MTAIQLYPVHSTSIKSVGYDAASKTLAIEFQSGKLYYYFEVPADLYKDFRNTPSLGIFFQDHIREQFPYDLVG